MAKIISVITTGGMDLHDVIQTQQYLKEHDGMYRILDVYEAITGFIINLVDIPFSIIADDHIKLLDEALDKAWNLYNEREFANVSE